MELEEFVEQQIGDCRTAYESGDYRQLIHAFRWCTMHEKSLPEWIANGALEALQFSLEKGGAAGKGKTGGHKAKIARDAIHKERHKIAAWQLDRRKIEGGNRHQAFERASEYLAGTSAQGSAGAIEESYNKIAAQFTPVKSA
jgi:hypothetical protein